MWCWKTRGREEGRGLLFPAAWFLTILTFFSLSRGKRADYILPLYPAASMIVARFWVSVIERMEAGRGGGHVRVLPLAYLAASFLTVVGLVALLAAPGLSHEIARHAP